ncbi:MAG: hypothetical protein ACLP1U_04100 [Terracidiphilus sp.]
MYQEEDSNIPVRTSLAGVLVAEEEEEVVVVVVGVVELAELVLVQE